MNYLLIIEEIFEGDLFLRMQNVEGGKNLVLGVGGEFAAFTSFGDHFKGQLGGRSTDERVVGNA